jgi:hypothetical protein
MFSLALMPIHSIVNAPSRRVSMAQVETCATIAPSDRYASLCGVVRFGSLGRRSAADHVVPACGGI